jgi:hypothetical protein
MLGFLASTRCARVSCSSPSVCRRWEHLPCKTVSDPLASYGFETRHSFRQSAPTTGYISSGFPSIDPAWQQSAAHGAPLRPSEPQMAVHRWYLGLVEPQDQVRDDRSHADNAHHLRGRLRCLIHGETLEGHGGASHRLDNQDALCVDQGNAQ